MLISEKWDQHSFETSVFKYTRQEFFTLKRTTVVTAAISLYSAVLIIVIYIYMLIYHRSKANRVSLRCVFMCTLSDAVNAIMNISMTNQRGDTQFCRAAGIILEFSNILSASLLTLVGLNLVLIFVINIKRKDLLEKFYYPSAVLYTLIGISIPIYEEVTRYFPTKYSRLSCWYLRYIEDRTNNIFSWMWFYGFIFFINIVAVICSILAMSKLIHEQKQVASKMRYINASSSFTNNNTDQHLEKTVKKRHNSVFTKVVLRCIIYPLGTFEKFVIQDKKKAKLMYSFFLHIFTVPFLVNIFGFILQMIITTSENTPSFVLAMLDIVFSCIEGFFVAVVFFTDPAITSFIKSAYNSLVQKYVVEYTLVPKPNGDINAIPTHCKKTTSTFSLSPCPSIQSSSLPLTTDDFIRSPSSAAISSYGRHLNVHATNQLFAGNQSEPVSMPIDTYYRHESTRKTKIIPMRRLEILAPSSMTSSERNRFLRKNKKALQDETTLALPPALMIGNDEHVTSIANANNAKIVYIPYRYTFIATCIHYFLIYCFCVHRHKTTVRLPERLLLSKEKESEDTLCAEEFRKDDDDNCLSDIEEVGCGVTSASASFNVATTNQRISVAAPSIASTQHF
ncbi:MAG: hypothetical protein EXX96DRAFT_556540 [Benjaminiella poitrasii]|nr:MAG: hypothetical protein EXX96DRAFT_556540 [Benjaminiella poitrasii]